MTQEGSAYKCLICIILKHSIITDANANGEKLYGASNESQWEKIT